MEKTARTTEGRPPGATTTSTGHPERIHAWGMIQLGGRGGGRRSYLFLPDDRSRY